LVDEGISYYSDTYSLTLHGEQVALAHAAAHGEGEIIAIAIASNEDKKMGEFTNPCHMCKQLLYETKKRNKLQLLVILTNNNNEVKEIQLDEMISYSWPE
jgi:cytidine deaminase